MTKLPVIFVVLQPRASADGGTASIGEIMTRLRDHRPIVVADRTSPRLEEWRAIGIETHIVPQAASHGLARDPLRVLRSYYRYTGALRQLIAESGARVVHANDPTAFQLALPAVKLSRGTRIVLNLRDTLDPDRKPPRLRYSFLFAAADHVFYLSNDMADRWSKVTSNAQQSCTVTYSIVDPKQFAASPPGSRNDPPVALLCGLIRRKKGQLEFLRHVAPQLAAEGIATWLAGDFDPSSDTYMSACADAAAPLGDMVKFLGYRSDIPDLMSRSSVVVIASRHEGLVRAMIEAMSCARPVVSFDISSARELLLQESGGAGTVVEAGDYQSMANAILGYCRDAEAAARAAKKGRATASRLFAADEVVSRYERVYRSLESGE